MSELEQWIKSTLGRETWPKRDDVPVYPSQREFDIVAHYEREVARGRLTMAQAYERACNDLQGRNGHVSLPQRGKAYRAVTLNVVHGGKQP